MVFTYCCVVVAIHLAYDVSKVTHMLEKLQKLQSDLLLLELQLPLPRESISSLSSSTSPVPVTAAVAAARVKSAVTASAATSKAHRQRLKLLSEVETLSEEIVYELREGNDAKFRSFSGTIYVTYANMASVCCRIYLSILDELLSANVNVCVLRRKRVLDTTVYLFQLKTWLKKRKSCDF
jgi:hypothetical protein